LIQGIRPAALRNKISDKMLRANPVNKLSVSYFFRKLQEATEEDRFHLETANERHARSKRTNEGDKGQEKKKRTKWEHSSQINKKGEWREYKCLVEGCQEKHKIKEHPNITKDQKDKAYAKLRENRKNKIVSSYLRFMKQEFTTGELIVNEKIKMRYCPDTGAQGTCCSKRKLKSIEYKPYKIPVIELQLPIKKDGIEKHIRVDTAADLDLKIMTNSGALILRNVTTLLLDEEMDEYILGNEHLLNLGINIEKELERLAGRQVDLKEEQDRVDKYMHQEEIKIGYRIEAEIEDAIQKMMERASKNGAKDDEVQAMYKIVNEYKDIWRTKLGPDPPTRVTPLTIRMKSDAKTIKTKARPTGKLQREFIQQRTKELEEFGYIRKNMQSRSAHPVHIVPKVPIPTRDDLANSFRWTGDYRQQNAMVDPIIWPMPNLEVLSERVQGCKYFQTFDAFKGFWQLPLAPESQEYFSFITEDGVYTPTRVPQGCCDSVMYFQSTMQDVFQTWYLKAIVIWLDDIMKYNKTFGECLQTMKYVFQRCRDIGLYLNPNKTNLYHTAAKFCGKIFTPNGIQQDPERIHALANMQEPTTAGELQQFICAMNWLRNALPDFSRISQPLRDKLEQIYLKLGKRTKRACKNYRIQLSANEQVTFNTLKQLVQNAIELAYPSEEAEYGLFCDASEHGWGAMLLQIKDYKHDIPWEEQNSEPLACLGGLFRGSSKQWPIVEKEGFAIKEAISRLDYLLRRPKGFRIFTDHRNLQYIFNESNHCKKATSQKLERWALYLSSFRYCIEHIAGERNVWADLLSRWAQPKDTTTLCRLTIPLHPKLEDFSWPTLDEIEKSQQRHLPNNKRTDIMRRNQDTHYTTQANPDIFWIPEDDVELKHRLMIIAHCGLSGHRGTAATLRHLQQYCYWKNQITAVRTFIHQCLLCLQIRGGKVMPRPLGTQMHATGPNQIIHFDYLKLPLAYNGWTYILVIKDDYSQKVKLVGHEAADAECTAKALMHWFSQNRIVETWISDQGSHFKNKVIEELSKLLQTKHHFTTAYTPWANGTVERVNRDLLEVLIATLKELKKSTEEWPDVVAQIEFVLNHTERVGLAGHSPVEIHGGVKPSKAMDVIFDTQKLEIVSAPITKAIQSKYEQLLASLTKMHKKVDAKKEKTRRTKHRRKVSQQTQLPNFHKGDYVLWSQVDQKHHDKLQVRWTGPFRITQILSDYVYVIEHLITGEKKEVHCTRLRFYSDKGLKVTEEIYSHINTQGMIYAVNCINGIRFNTSNKKWEVQTNWAGFQNIEDSWEPLITMLEDVPTKVLDYLKVYQENSNDDYKLLVTKLQKDIQKIANKQSNQVRSLLLKLIK
jgi:transposase InsO family protein